MTRTIRTTKTTTTSETTKRAPSKTKILIGLLSRPEGASIAELSQAVGWLPHSVRGFMAGTLRKKHGLKVTSEKIESGRVYRAVSATTPQ